MYIVRMAQAVIRTRGESQVQKQKILVVEDEEKIREVVISLLEGKGYEVYSAEDGHTALELVKSVNLSLILLDLMLPDMSGEEICRKVRTSLRVPIIMLTAKVEEADLLEGLSIGADDYITKPFSLRELGARVEAVLRRTAEALTPLYQTISFNDGDLIIEVDSKTVLKQKNMVKLTESEWRILVALMKYPKKIFTRNELITLALGMDFEGYDRAIDSHIKNLRQKIEDNPRQPVYVLTVHKQGYQFGGELS